jgi:hypothetical protein
MSVKAIEAIRTYLNDYACGWKNPEATAAIAGAVAEIRAEFGDHVYVREKLVSLNGWVDKLYSPRKHAPWGLDRVKQFIFSDCYRLEMYLEKIRRAGEL